MSGRTWAPFELGLISLDFEDWECCVEEASKRECAVVEIYVSRSFDESDQASLRDRLTREGVRASAISTLAKLAQVDDDNLPDALDLIRSSLDVAAAVGAPSISFMYGGCDVLNRHEARQRFVERLAPVISRARTRGLSILVENVFSRSPSGDLDSVEVTQELFSLIDDPIVKLNFDPGNFEIGGEEAYPYAYERLRPYIGGMHVKDVARYVPERHGSLDEMRPLVDYRRGRFVTEPLGRGSINWKGLLQALGAWPERPPLLLEPFCSGGRRSQWLEESLQFIRNLIEEKSLDADRR